MYTGTRAHTDTNIAHDSPLHTLKKTNSVSCDSSMKKKSRLA